MKKISAIFLTVCILCMSVCALENDVAEQMSADGGYSYNFVDPGWMSDEDFFGVYDKERRVFTNPGKLNYDGFSGLAGVKELVEAGDYEGAKEAYKEYYVKKKERLKLSKSSTSKQDIIISKMYENQVMYNHVSATLVDMVKFTNDETTVSMDVTSDVKSIMGASDKRSIFQLIALKKDGSSAEIYSRSAAAGKRPVIEVTINGILNRIEPYGDTYICGGEKENMNYGNEEMIRVEESVSSIQPEGAWETGINDAGNDINTNGVTDRFDDANTKRAYFMFDFSTLSSADITSAVFKLTGKNAGGTGDMEILCFRNADTAIEEDTVTWCRKGSFANEHYVFNSYGFKDPDGIETIFYAKPYGMINRYYGDVGRFEGTQMSPVKMFSETGNEYYGYVACKMFGDYVKMRGGKYDDSYTSLCAACRLLYMPNLIMKIITSRHMSAELFTALMKNLWLNADYMQYTFRPGTNWGSFQMSGLFTTGAYFNEFSDYYNWVEKPDSPKGYTENVSLKYIQSAAYRMSLLSQNTIIDEDYSSTEKSVGYCATNMNMFLNPLAVTDVTGVAFPYNDETMKRVVGCLTYLRDLLGPGGYDIQWGNSGSHNVKMKYVIEHFLKYYDVPSLKWYTSGGKEGTPPDYTSVLYPGAKVAIMKSGWDDNASYLHTSYDITGVHAHDDDLSPIIFAKGKYLLSDQSYSGYALDASAQNWLVSAEAHNVIKINEKFPNNTSELNDWTANGGFDLFAATKTNNEVSFKRNIFFVCPDYWIVTDYLVPNNKETENTYRQMWHMPPDAKLAIADETSNKAKSCYDDVNLSIIPVGGYKLEAEIREGYYGTGSTTDMSMENYVNYIKNEKGTVTYNTILRPEIPDENLNVNTTEIEMPGVTENGASAFAMDISSNGKKSEATYYIVNDEQQKGKRDVVDYNFDGKIFYAEKANDGSFKNISLYKGKELKEKGKTIIKTGAPSEINDLSVSFDGSVMNIQSSESKEDIGLDKITVLAGDKTEQVKYNGEEISFSRTKNYIYFGNEPIEVDEEYSTPDKWEIITGDVIMDETFSYSGADEMYRSTGASVWNTGKSVDISVEKGVLMFKSLSTGTDGIKLPIPTETDNEGVQTVEMRIKRSDANTFWQLQFFGKEADGSEKYFTMLDLNSGGLGWKAVPNSWTGSGKLTAVKGMEPETILGILNEYIKVKLLINWNDDTIKLYINDVEQDAAPIVFDQAKDVVKVSRIDILKQSASADNTVTSIDKIRVVNGEINKYASPSAYTYKDEFNYANVDDIFEGSNGYTSGIDSNIPASDQSTVFELDGKGRLKIKQSTANGETANTNGIWMPLSGQQADVKYVEMKIKRSSASNAWYNISLYGANSQGVRRPLSMLEHVNNKQGLQWKAVPWNWTGGGNIKTLKDGRKVDSISDWTVIKLKINFKNQSIDGLWIDGEKQDTCPVFYSGMDIVSLTDITFNKQVSTADGEWVGIDYVRIWDEPKEEQKLDVEILEDNGTYTVNAVMNDLGYFKSNVITVYYDKAGRVIGMNISDINEMAMIDNGTAVRSVSYKPVLANIKKAKVMAVDSLTNFVPLCGYAELIK